MSKLALGTVQLGLKYGIKPSSHQKPPSFREAANIMNAAQIGGVDLIDTAFEYGDSEQICGRLQSANYTPKIVTKTPKLRAGTFFASSGKLIEKAYEISCENLRVPKCETLLIHDVGNLMQPGGEYMMDAVYRLKQLGRVNSIGVSIYNREQLDHIWDRFDLDVVQLPLNILDQRLLSDGTLASLKERGVEIHVRSVFLQGLLLMNSEEIPEGLSAILPALNNLRLRCESVDESIKEVCYRFVSDLPEVDKVVCGVNTSEQLCELIDVAERCEPIRCNTSPIEVIDESLLNPANWAQKINI